MLRGDLGPPSFYIEKIVTFKSSIYESALMILNDCTFICFSTLEETKTPVITSV